MVDQEEIHRKCNSDNPKERIEAVEQLRSSFKDISDKKQTWQDLHGLTKDPNPIVRRKVVESLGAIFEYVLDKGQAWQDLHKLAADPNPKVKEKAAETLGAIFDNVPDKGQAWQDLIKLTADQDKRVRWKAEKALETALKTVPDKGQMLKYLTEMTRAPDSYVKVNAYHSLGRISIYKASQSKSEEAYLEELKKAIEFFEKASKVPISFNPSKFCFPFYRSFYTMISGKQEVKDEVENYLAQANKEKGWSKNNELLIKTVENLSNALKEVQNLENMDLGAKKEKLNECRKQCDKAVRSMRDTASSDEDAVREGIDRKLKSLLEEIQEKAKTACRESQGTETEEIACAVNDFAENLVIGSPKYLVKQIESLVFLLKSYIPKIEENNLILNRINQILKEEDVVDQYTLLNNLIPQIIDIQVSGKTAPILDNIKKLKGSVDGLTESIDELQNPQEYLDTIQRNLEEIKDDIPDMKEKIDKVLYELYSPLSTTQKLKVAIPLIPMLATYEIQTDIPKLVADKISELNNLVLRFKNK